VIGPNGAGKTTLMRVISGLIRPTAGAIGMEGTDVLATPPHRILALGIAHVPENRRLFARMTVEDNLRMGAYIAAARPKFRQRLDFVYDLFPRIAERRAPVRRHDVGRRAADVRDRPRADVGPSAAAAGRTLGRPGAGGRAAGVRAWCAAFAPAA
jgi:ABC-type sugar transport system ATPase subunit